MTVTRRCIRCGAVDRGMDMWGIEHARSCSGPVLDEDEARSLLQLKGAVSTLDLTILRDLIGWAEARGKSTIGARDLLVRLAAIGGQS